MTTTPEAYVHLSTDETTLTFYYDTLRAERDGTTWGIGEKKIEEKVEFCAWAGTYYHLNRTITIVVFDASFGDFFPTTTDCWFYSLKSLKSIEGFEYLNTSQVTKMWGMFEGCESLTSLDLSSFDTSKVTDMGSMFSGCKSLTTLDLSSFDTSKVTSMRWMFWECKSLTALDLSSFDTSKVKSMSHMFLNCESLTSIDLSSFDISKVTEMRWMFSGCSSLTMILNNSWWNCESSEGMFEGCVSLKGEVAYDDAQIGGNLANPKGYFTRVLQAYVHRSTDLRTLTFYYDTLRAERDGTTWGIEETRKSYVNPTPAWIGRLFSLNTIIFSAVLDASFRDFRPTTTARWFQDFPRLKSIEGLEHLNTSQVTDMTSMFDECKSLTSLDLSSFDTSRVTDMGAMFRYCKSLTALNLSSFDTSKVMDMNSMFWDCSSLTSLDLSSFDTSQVTKMSDMFFRCESLTYLDLSSFDTSQVTKMSDMFSGCKSLTRLDLSNFYTSKVTDMSDMFFGDKSLTTIYCNSSWSCGESYGMFSFCNCLRGAMAYDGKSYDVSMANPERGFFTKKVLAQEDEAYVHLSADKKTLTFYFDRERNFRMRYYAWGIEETALQNGKRIPAWLSGEVVSKKGITKIVFDESFRNVVPKTTAGWFEDLTAVTEICGLDNLNTSEVTDMSRMFAGCGALRSLDVSRFDTLNVKQMQQMFMGCAALTEIDLYFFDTAKVTNMHEMFKDCKGLTTLDLQSFNTSQVTDMGEMFRDCESLTTLVLSSFYTSRVTNMGYMFAGCKSLTTLNLAHFFTENVTTMWRMFEGCSALESLVISCFNTAQVTDMSRMFAGCKSLTALDLLNFNTAQVRNMVQMFADCSALADLDISRFSTAQVTDMHEMFLGCAALSALNLAHLDTAQVTDLHAMFKDCKGLTTLDLSNFQTSEVKDMREMFSGCSALTTIWSFAFRNCFASEAMFYECTSLQGATNFNEKYTDARMANPERGYFSRK